MLPQAHRLASRRDFNRVYTSGRQWRTPLFSLYALPRGRTEPRFGISVNKKVGGAVERNLVKRRLRESCRMVLRNPLVPLDFVLVARPPSREASFELLSRSVDQLVSRAVKEVSECTSQRTGGQRRQREKRP